MGFDPEKFLAARAVEPKTKALKVVEEMHPDISTIDRMVVKNLSQSPEVGVNYIKKKLPGHDVRLYQGRMVVKGPQDKEYRVMDPDTGLFSTDILRDAGDVLFDVGSGVAEGAATTAGTAAGAVAGPAGAIAGGAAAAGASGAGLEAARQGLGKLAGLEQDIDPTDVAISGGVSAALPLVGAAAKGTYNAAKKSVLPWIGEKVSGASRDAIKTLGKHFPTLENMEKDGAMGLVEDAHGRLVKGIGSIKSGIGQKLQDAIEGAGEKVDISGVKDVMRKLLVEAKTYADDMDTPAMKEEIANIAKEFDRLFTTEVKEMAEDETGELVEQTIKKEIGDEVSARTAFKLQEKLGDLAELAKMGEGPKARFGNAATRAEKQLAETAREGYNTLNQEFERVTGGLSKDLKDSYRDFSMIQKYLNPHFKDTSKTFTTLTGLNKKAKEPLFDTLKNLQKKTGINVLDDARILEAHGIFNKPSLLAISSGGTTSTSRSIPLAVGGASIGTLAGYQSDSLPGSPYAKATMGGLIGGAVGSSLGSPAMIKSIIKNGLRAERAAAKIKPGTVPGVAKSIWELGRER